jgi:DNA-binding transcriptional ArsR family regulator
LSARNVFVAIADPTRRRILDLLRRQGPLIAGDIAARFRRNSRPGISRHLRILRECGLLDARDVGKTRAYLLNPGPLRALHAGWLAHFADEHTASLRALRRRVERGES